MTDTIRLMGLDAVVFDNVEDFGIDEDKVSVTDGEGEAEYAVTAGERLGDKHGS